MNNKSKRNHDQRGEHMTKILGTVTFKPTPTQRPSVTGSSVPTSLNQRVAYHQTQNMLFSGSVPLQKKMQQLKELSAEIQSLQASRALEEWDLETDIPSGAKEAAGDRIVVLDNVIHEKATSKRLGTLLNTLQQPENFSTLNPVDQTIVRILKRDYEQDTKLPASYVKALSETGTKGHQAWIEARKNNDFNHFAPYLEKLVALKQQEAKYLGYKDHPYDALLDEYEPGLTVKTLDPLFAALKQEIVPLLKAIQNSGKHPDTSFVGKAYSEKGQLAFSKVLLKAIGFDFNRGRQGISVHPFTTSFGSPNNVAVTFRYNNKDPRDPIGSVMHEGGHGLYEQGVAPELAGTVLADLTSLGIHESQSRLMENPVGKSLAFWERFLPVLKRHFPKQLAGVQPQQYYAAINDVKPSLIRVDADEVTYNLHILLRYEIERDLIEGKLQVKDLPKVWNQKMYDYLGVVPSTDSEGVLQDIHWSDGSLGYFPTYTLGNLYAAQFFKTAKQQMPKLESQIRKGNLAPLKQWLNQQIHRVGRMESSDQIVKRVTGEALSSTPFIDYLWEKFGPLYGISRKQS
jgi:carboxypeptidase Taq